MKNIRRLLAAIALAACFSAPSWSASYSTDQSDLWWIPGESGWGIQLVQRNSTIFATMFVYDQSDAATWYVATMVATGLTWTGDLYATKGPWFGAVPFDSNAVSATKVGTMTWTAATVLTGALTYTVNGMQVTKNVQREYIALDDFQGDYGGNWHQVSTDCSDPTQNGTKDLPTAIAIRQSGSSIVLATVDENFKRCTYTGPLSQGGQMGCSSGSFTCTDNTQGTFSFCEMQVNVSGFTTRFDEHAAPGGCTTTGWFGGGRGTTF